MVGNDIIDLVKAAQDSNWQRKGYLQKICSTDEQQLISNAPDPFTMLWLLWSMKESAYKIINRETGLRFYQPAALECKILSIDANKATGLSQWKGQSFSSISMFSAHQLHSIAAKSQNNLAAIQTMYFCNCPEYLTVFNTSQTQYQLSKDKNGLPKMFSKVTGQSHAVSVSHHGSKLAIAYSDFPLSAD